MLSSAVAHLVLVRPRALSVAKNIVSETNEMTKGENRRSQNSMSAKNATYLGTAIVFLFWSGLGIVFISAGPRYVAPKAAYAAGFVFICLAIFFIIATIRQRRAKLTARWKRKDLTSRWS